MSSIGITRQQRKNAAKQRRAALARQETARRLELTLRTMWITAALVTLVVVGAGIHQMLATSGAWGRFVPWTVFTMVATSWPVAFLLAAPTAPERRPRFHAGAGLVTVFSPGLLLAGWGLAARLDPEHAIGWYIPARGGGNQIATTQDAYATGTVLVIVGLVMGLAMAAAVATLFLASHRPPSRTQSHTVEKVEIGDEAGTFATHLLWLAAGLFWVVGLILGLIALILPDSVTDTLARCGASRSSCAADAWVADNLPWLLTTASLAAMLVGIVIFRAADRLGGVLTLAASALLHAGSVVAVAVGVRYLQWQDTTCGSPDSFSRNCGGRDPDFSFADGWLSQTVLLGLVTYAALAYLLVFPLLARVDSLVSAGQQAPGMPEAPGH